MQMFWRPLTALCVLAGMVLIAQSVLATVVPVQPIPTHTSSKLVVVTEEVKVTQIFQSTFSLINQYSGQILVGVQTGKIAAIITAFTAVQSALIQLGIACNAAFLHTGISAIGAAQLFVELLFKVQAWVIVLAPYPFIAVACRAIFLDLNFHLQALITFFQVMGVNLEFLIQQRGVLNVSAWATLGFSFHIGEGFRIGTGLKAEA